MNAKLTLDRSSQPMCMRSAEAEHRLLVGVGRLLRQLLGDIDFLPVVGFCLSIRRLLLLLQTMIDVNTNTTTTTTTTRLHTKWGAGLRAPVASNTIEVVKAAICACSCLNCFWIDVSASTTV